VALRRPTEPRVPPVKKILDLLVARQGADSRGPNNVRATIGTNRTIGKALSDLSAVLMKGSLEARLREIVILRIGWDSQSVYEFGQHTLFGRQAGLSEDEIYLLSRPISEGRWSAKEQSLIQMTDDIHADDCVSDETWRELKAYFSDEEIIEAMAVAMNWRMVSTLLNSCGVALDEGVPGWPDRRTGG